MQILIEAVVLSRFSVVIGVALGFLLAATSIGMDVPFTLGRGIVILVLGLWTLMGSGPAINRRCVRRKIISCGFLASTAAMNSGLFVVYLPCPNSCC